MTAKHRMSIKLTRDQRRLLKRLAKHFGTTMTDILVRGIELMEAKRQAQEATFAGTVAGLGD